MQILQYEIQSSYQAITYFGTVSSMKLLMFLLCFYILSCFIAECNMWIISHWFFPLLSNKWKLAKSIVSQLFRNFLMDCVYSKDFIYKESLPHRSSHVPISQLAQHNSCGKNVQFHYDQHTHLYYKLIIPLWWQIFGNGNCRTAIGKKPRKQNIFFYILFGMERSRTSWFIAEVLIPLSHLPFLSSF